MPAHFPQLASPFHKGEQKAQTFAGTRERTEMIGQRAIRPFMPNQHRDFFEQIPFVILGSVDPDGLPWASIITGGAGFMTAPDEASLKITAAPGQHDPLANSLVKDAPIGVIGIELGTRRRNRMNAKVSVTSPYGIKLDVVQSFGNCPKYIQTHDITFTRLPDAPIQLSSDSIDDLDGPARAAIAKADTFFVASYVADETGTAAQSVDVSHRGGRSGFVKVDGNSLTIPDYPGNNFFNTIGNFLETPKAGLLFPDFTTGDVLMLTGRVEMLWEDHPDVRSFEGAERGWRFTLHHGIRIYDALPFRAKFKEYSPYSLKMGRWDTATPATTTSETLT